MKILPLKSDVDKIKAQERKREVDEGAKWAKKIDVLREMASEEEKNLRLFHENSMVILKKDIESLIAQKNSLNSDIERLKGIYKELETKVESITNNK